MKANVVKEKACTQRVNYKSLEGMHARRGQRGAILIVSIIILLVMTMVGVSSMMSTTLQERMSGSSRQRTVARQTAEAALRAAEAFMRANITSTPTLSNFDGSTAGLYANATFYGQINQLKPAEGTGNPLGDLTDQDNWTAGNSIGVTGLSSDITAADPRYIVEYLGRDEGPAVIEPFDPNKAVENLDPHIFRIVAIGWARDTNIYSVLQSSFRTGYSSGAVGGVTYFVY